MERKSKQAKISSVCVCVGGGRRWVDVGKWCMMHGSSYRLLTQLCLVAFGERSLRPEGAHLIRVNHGDTLLTALPHRKRALCTAIVCTGRQRTWRRYNAWMAKTDSRGRFFNNECGTQPSDLKKPRMYKQQQQQKHRRKKKDIVKLVEVESRLSIKCTCYQTSAKVEYSSLYVHNYICSRCINHRCIWNIYDNSSLYVKM